jgi:hypothetical protein
LRAQRDHSRDVCVHHAEYGRGIEALRHQRPAGVQQRLSRRRANHFSVVLEAGVEPVMAALAAPIK